MSWLGPVALFSAVQLVGAVNLQPPDSASIPSRIWQTSPGVYWNDSFLIGNGRLGAVVAGSAPQDVIHVNEDSLWSGGYLHRVNPDAASQIPIMQEEIRNGNVEDAATLGSYAYVATPVSAQHYDPLGDLTLTMSHGTNLSNYERWLDVADGTTGIYYTVSGVQYQREMFDSEPAGVIAMRIVSDTAGAVSFNIHLDRGEGLNRWEDYSHKVGSDATIMGGGSGGLHPIQFAAGVRVASTDGQVSTLGDTVFCKNATEAWVYFAARTSFYEKDPKAAVLSDLHSQGQQPYSEVRSAHVKDYQTFFNRTSLDLGISTSIQTSQTTSQRLAGIANGTFDPEITVLYFQFARYLLISTSRSGTLPPNLQGIWNSDFDPTWGSKYTININLEMNYWPSLVTNLADLNSPLYDLIDRLDITGRETARLMYNKTGAVAHHNTDLWADSAPQDNYFSSTYYAGGLAWLSTHLMQDYLFTGNETFLHQQYHVLRDVAEFYLTFMTDYKGYLVTNPSISPENVYYLPNSTMQAAITAGPTIDNSLAWEILGFVMDIGASVGEEQSFLTRVAEVRARLPPLRVSYFGGIQEWIEDYKETDPAHRHFSPLWGLYPGSQITSANATAFNAAKATLDRRLTSGGGDTGWSRAWAISLAARSLLPEEVHNSLLEQLVNHTYPTSMLDILEPAPFQIDGNFGAPAGIAEALLQSHEFVAAGSNGSSTAVPPAYGNTRSPVTTATAKQLDPAYFGDKGVKYPLIRLLPALPQAWAENGGGSVKGLRSRGGFEIDISWDGRGALLEANITSLTGSTTWITLGSEAIGPDAAKTNVTGSAITIDGSGSGRFVLLQSREGASYRVTAS